MRMMIMLMMMVCHNLLCMSARVISKTFRDFVLAQNNSELLVDVANWWEKLENKKLASMNKAKQSKFLK